MRLFYLPRVKLLSFILANYKDTEFLSEETSKQYEYRRQTWLPQKPLSDLFFQAYARRARALFLCIF